MTEQKWAFIGSKSLGLKLLDAAIPILGEPVFVLHAADAGDTRSVAENFQRHIGQNTPFCSEGDASSYRRPRHEHRPGSGLGFKGSDPNVSWPLGKPSCFGTTAQEMIERFKPDLVLVSGWYRRLPIEKFPDIPFIATHFSLLPEYRGFAPLVWQILEGADRLGLSVFRMDAGLDTGPLYATATIGYDFATETIGDALRKLEESTVALVSDILADPNRHEKLTPQDEGGFFCGRRDPEDGKIDWSMSPFDVTRFVHAQSKPYPGAFSFPKGGEVVKIWRVEPVSNVLGVPGSVVAGGGKPVIACGGWGGVKLIEWEGWELDFGMRFESSSR